MDFLDNRERTLKDDLQKTITADSKVSIAAACFSIYAFQELKEELEQVEEVNFIFTSPTFVKEEVEKTQKEFYIPSLYREKNICGTEFEVKLKNELNQKAIAKECANWIKNKATFKTNVSNENMPGFINVDETTYSVIKDFTTVDLGCERGNNAYYPIQKMEAHENARYFLNTFDELWQDPKRLKDVTDEVISSITAAYKENSPEFLYFFTLYNIFSEFLEDVSEDVLPNEATGFKNSEIWNTLYDFQKDAAIGIINKLEKYNGCILADSVGLGKTFTSLAVVKYYETRNKSVLVLCPKKLSENWNTYKGNYVNNPLKDDRFRYDVLYHTDLSRDRGYSNGIDLSRLNWENYDLLVIDESHNFRNGGLLSGEEKRENRYLKLMNKVIKQGVKTKVLMLSATPVNNKLIDLKHQIALSYENNSENIDDKLRIKTSIDDVFKRAQTEFNLWSKLPPEERTTDNLLRRLDFDFFEVLDSVTIARSRKHIEKYYEMSKIGKFPERLKPISKRPELSSLNTAINYNEIFDQIIALSLAIYIPSNYLKPSKVSKYEELFDIHGRGGLTQVGREQGIRKLMSINLLKRLESSVHSFNLTIKRIYALIDDTIAKIDMYMDTKNKISVADDLTVSDFDDDDLNNNMFSVGKKVQIELEDMDYLSWRDELVQDKETLELLISMISDITPEYDSKLQTLKSVIDEKITHPINPNNKKVIVFTAFKDTADYLYNQISTYVSDKYHLNTVKVTGSDEGKCTIPKIPTDLNTVLTLFSPKSKKKDMLFPDNDQEIDILIATDCISEGQNLQDCDYLINYDIHWNPVRIIQRFGRIDRIGSQNEFIQLVNFWPDLSLDEYIHLKSRVETKMKISVMTSTGDDNLISAEEQGDLEYRKRQLKRLQEEVVDIEDMDTGISIMDLGLNEYKISLSEYMKDGVNFNKVPTGLHTVVKTNDTCPEGTIFILKNLNDSVNMDSRNRIHPFYMVYIANDGEVVVDHLNPKAMFDSLKLLAYGYEKPIEMLTKQFNKETRDGKNMRGTSELLSCAINSIIEAKDESDIDSLFSEGGTTALLSDIKGIDDFELISFFVVR